MEHQETGKVWLAGAGPGDAGLLTRKAEQVLESADVVVYDHLVGRDILARIRPDQNLRAPSDPAGEDQPDPGGRSPAGEAGCPAEGRGSLPVWQGRRRAVKA